MHIQQQLPQLNNGEQKLPSWLNEEAKKYFNQRQENKQKKLEQVNEAIKNIKQHHNGSSIPDNPDEQHHDDIIALNELLNIVNNPNQTYTKDSIEALQKKHTDNNTYISIMHNAWVKCMSGDAVEKYVSSEISSIHNRINGNKNNQQSNFFQTQQPQAQQSYQPQQPQQQKVQQQQVQQQNNNQANHAFNVISIDKSADKNFVESLKDAPYNIHADIQLALKQQVEKMNKVLEDDNKDIEITFTANGKPESKQIRTGYMSDGKLNIQWLLNSLNCTNNQSICKIQIRFVDTEPQQQQAQQYQYQQQQQQVQKPQQQVQQYQQQIQQQKVQQNTNNNEQNKQLWASVVNAMNKFKYNETNGHAIGIPQSLDAKKVEYKDQAIQTNITHMQKYLAGYQTVRGDGNCGIAASILNYLKLQIANNKKENLLQSIDTNNAYMKTNISLNEDWNKINNKNMPDIPSEIINKNDIKNYVLNNRINDQAIEHFIRTIELITSIKDSNNLQNAQVSMLIDYYFIHDRIFRITAIVFMKSIILNSAAFNDKRGFMEHADIQRYATTGTELDDATISILCQNIKTTIYIHELDKKDTNMTIKKKYCEGGNLQEKFIQKTEAVNYPYKEDAIHEFFRTGHYDVMYLKNSSFYYNVSNIMQWAANKQDNNY